jgi:5-methylcytosine-specific restriction endonuclease McrA
VKRKKLKSLSSLENKLDRVFSTYIRKRDADEGGTIACVTCGRLLHWQECDAGHFVKRQHRSLRWHEANAAPQCKKCNRFQGGRQDDFAKHIIERYGKSTFDDLMAKKYEVKKFSRADLQEMIERYSG